MIRSIIRAGISFLGLLGWACLPCSLIAQDADVTKGVDVARNVEQDAVAATVGQTEIPAARIQRHLDRTVGDRPFTREQRKQLEVEALQHFVNRELVNHYLDGRNYDVGPNQIKIEFEQLTANLERVGKTLKDHLEKQGQSRESLEREIRWKIRWNAYLEKTLTDQVLRSYFDRHRRKFDGTEMHVAQILLATGEGQDSVEAAQKQALQIRNQIVAGETTWKAAVSEFSIAASKDREGDIGWIRYNEPMPKAFSQHAFGLNLNQIAMPLTSSFGVHLIKCLEVRQGKAEYGDVQDAVHTAASKDLFELMAKRQLSEVKVTYQPGWNPPQTPPKK